jgi:hypothetical protein
MELVCVGIVKNDAHTSADPGLGTVNAFGTDSTVNYSTNLFTPGQRLIMDPNPEMRPGNEPMWRESEPENVVQHIGEPTTKYFPSIRVYSDIHEYCETLKLDHIAADMIEQYGREFVIASITGDPGGWYAHAKDHVEGLQNENNPSYQYFKLTVARRYVSWCIENEDNGVDSVMIIEAWNNLKNMVQEFEIHAVEHATGDFKVLLDNEERWDNHHPVFDLKDMSLQENINSKFFRQMMDKLDNYVTEHKIYSVDRMIGHNYRLLLGTCMNVSPPGGQLDVMIKI